MGFTPGPPPQQIPVVDKPEGQRIHDSGGFTSEGKPAGPVMVDTSGAPMKTGFTPGPPPSAPAPPPMDATTAANVAASKTPEKLPGPQDLIDMIRGVPENLIPAIKGMVSSLNPAENVVNLAHGIRSIVANPQAALDALHNATGAQASPLLASALVGGAVNEGAGLAAGAGEGAAGATAANDAAAANLGLRTVGPITGRAADAGQVLSLQHQPVAKSVLGADAGVPHNVDVSHAALDKAAEAPGQLLDQGTSLLPPAPLSEAAQAQVRAARPQTGLIKPTPDVASYIDSTENSLLSDPTRPITGEELRATRAGLVSDANAGANSADAAVRQRSKYQRAVITALDQHVVDTMPPNSAISPDMIANARATLAKNYNLRDLITKGGDIDLPALAADYRENPNKFTGPTAVVAQFAHDHPEVTQPISNATRLSPPGFISDVANINPVHPIGSLAQTLFGIPVRRALRGAGNGNAALSAAEQTPVAGLAGEFEPKPMTSLTSPPGTAFEPHQPDLGMDPTLVGTPTTPSELASPRPPQTVPPGVQRIQAQGGQQAPLGLGDDFPGTPRENNSDLAGVKSQGVPEGTVQKSPKSSAPEFPELGRPLERAPEGAQTSANLSDHDNEVVGGVQRLVDNLNAKLGDNPGTGARGAMHKIVQHLADNLDGASEHSAFFKDIFSRLAGQQLATRLVAPGSPGHEALGSAFGSYQLANDTATLGNLKADPLITIAHEAVHGATAAKLQSDGGLQVQLLNIVKDARKSPAVQALSAQDQYGAHAKTNEWHEIVAESQSNPRFQQALRDSPSTKQPGKSLYDDLKKAIGTSLGLPPTAYNDPRFDQILQGNASSNA